MPSNIPVPGKVRTAGALAKLIAKEFGFGCGGSTISRWKRLEPPFPLPDDSSLYDKEECFEWVRKNVRKARVAQELGNASQTDAEKVISRDVSIARIKAAEARMAERKDKIQEGSLVEKDSVRQLLNATLQTYHAFIRSELEVSATDARVERLKVLGVGEQVLAAFFAYDMQLARDVVDRIELKCEEMAKGGELKEL